MMLMGTLYFHVCIFRKYSTLIPIQKQISIRINHTTYNDSLAAVVSICNHFLLKFTSLNVCFEFSHKLAADLFFMYPIGFLDLKNIWKDTKIMVIRLQGAEL